MSIPSEVASALSEVEGLIPQTFKHSSTSYACSASAYTTTRTLVVGGQEVDADLTISVRKSLFSGSLPAELDLITHRSQTFRIEKIVNEPTDIFLRLICASNT